MSSPARPLSLPPPVIAPALEHPFAAQRPLWQRNFFVPPAQADATCERHRLLVEGHARLAPEQRAMLHTMGWDMRVPAPTPRDQGTLSTPTPSLTDAFQLMGRQAIVVASGMHGVHVSTTDEETLRFLCRQRTSTLRDLDALIMDETVLEPLHKYSTAVTRFNVWAYLHAFGQGGDTQPAASLPRMYYLTFFRPLAVAFVASGLMGLWRAQAYLSCCEGAQVAAYLAFFKPTSHASPVADLPPPRVDGGGLRDSAARTSWSRRMGPVEVLRATRPPPPPPPPIEAPVQGMGPSGDLPIDLRFETL